MSLIGYHSSPVARVSSLSSDSRREKIAVIGGGFTGTIMAAQLLRHGVAPASLSVIERDGLPGRGVAYGTQHTFHLLNIPAKNMSAFPDDPLHFLRWVESHHDAATEPDAFLPRFVYGQYMEWVLRESVEAAGGEPLQWLRDEVVSIDRTSNQWVVGFRSGASSVADRVILCLGNFRPGDPILPGWIPTRSRHYISYPWSASAWEGIENVDSVLLLGSGLTSVDLAVGLRTRGFNGVVHIISRRGLLPQSHQRVSETPPFWNAASPRTTRGLLHWVREEVMRAEDNGINWRAVIDSLRPVTQHVWQSLTLVERRRFLRHVRPYWEVHRHRLAPQIAVLIGDHMDSGRIRIYAGRITRYREDQHGGEVTYRNRKSGCEEVLRAQRIINCTGPETDYRFLDDPLVKNLRLKGVARPDPLGLGLDVSNDGALVDTNGIPSDSLYVAGPARKGNVWETTAVPEIRNQVVELAKLLTGQRQHRAAR